MRPGLKFAVGFIFALLLCVSVNAQSEWAGSYEFDEDGGKTSGGTPIFVVHQLDILETEDGLIAMIRSSGFQTSRELTGTVKIEGSRLSIFFENYGEDNTFQTYRKGDLLFSLEKSTKNGKTEILTFWNEFQPVVPKNEKPGMIYFEKL